MTLNTCHASSRLHLTVGYVHAGGAGMSRKLGVSEGPKLGTLSDIQGGTTGGLKDITGGKTGGLSELTGGLTGTFRDIMGKLLQYEISKRGIMSSSWMCF
jgi:hypothetical protein